MARAQVFTWTACALLTLVVAAAGCFAWHFVQVNGGPAEYFHPLNRHVDRGFGGPWKPQTPSYFAVGARMEEVEVELVEAGFVETDAFMGSPECGTNCRIFERRFLGVCNVSVYIAVEVDQEGRLEEAKTRGVENGCM